MIQIRKGVFETNSSSVHSIVIPRETQRIPNSKLVFKVDGFGTVLGEADALDYLYTYLVVMERDDLILQIKRVLDEDGVDYDFIVPDGEYDDCYIDQIGSMPKEFIIDLFSNDDKLRRYLYGGKVYTGADWYDYEDMCYAAREPEEDDYFVNEWRDTENYEYYLKGC